MLRVPDRSGFFTYVSGAGYVVIVDEQGGLDGVVSIAIHPDHLPALARWLRQVAQPAIRRQLLVAVRAHEQKAAAESGTP
jgi:hypothetical protein